jgi:hypothetical protein
MLQKTGFFSRFSRYCSLFFRFQAGAKSSDFGPKSSDVGAKSTWITIYKKNAETSDFVT